MPYNNLQKTRGPRGPWVAHLMKRSKVTVEPIIENPRGIIWTTLVENLLMMLYIEYESTGPCSFRQEDFWKFYFKTYLLTPWLSWTTLIGDHPGIIPVKFGQIPINGSREYVVWSFPYIIQCKIVTPGRGQFWPQVNILNNFSRGILDDAIYQIWKLWAL